MAPPGIVCASQSQVMPPPPPQMPPPPASTPVKIACAPTGVRQPQQLSVQTSTGGVPPPAASGSLMSPNTAKRKCKNFLSTLIRLASDQPAQTAANVKGLIQGLIDGAIPPEDFTKQLEQELHSSPQPCLVPFLRKSLPYLRHSLMTKELSIEGVRPPSHAALALPPAAASMARSLQKGTAGRALLPRSAAAQLQMMPPLAAAQLGGPINLQGLLAQQQRFAAAVRPTVGAQGVPKSIIMPKPTAYSSCLAPAVLPFNMAVSTAASLKTTMPTGGGGSSGGGKEKRTVGSLGIDDDINDVATMGGVDLTEESQKSTSTAVAGEAEARSCKDENFLSTAPLQRKIGAIAARHGISEVPDVVVALVSHATQERLKTLVEKLSIVAEHRQENMRNVARCEVTGDVRQQLRFLEALDKLEKQRHDEEEREMIMRAARSRSRGDDAEQLKLRQRARDLQRAEMEEARQREANATALMALGPRKKPKTEGATVHTPIVLRPRPKRVNARDLLFLLEQEKSTFNSDLLYKAYMKF
ncbi:hypothetical protein HPB48_004630 [Haemaphysalis longicornis]|uniref:TAFH domain-containing protein n=1 Tax=Haemaphysalis longicornis TaxID=44386 RepID=A0A9J6G0T3_HAELO|nr:hypothetical protein HPB48_004630 [Haemaphysalis longicornis]